MEGTLSCLHLPSLFQALRVGVGDLPGLAVAVVVLEEDRLAYVAPATTATPEQASWT